MKAYLIEKNPDNNWIELMKEELSKVRNSQRKIRRAICDARDDSEISKL